MITTLLSKFGLPIVLCLAAFSGGMITNQKLQKPVVIPAVKIPPCNCPPAQGIDLDKVKGKNIDLTVNQNYKLDINGDSLAIERIREALRIELEDFKVKRCR